MKKVIVIGGGPAGMMAAIAASGADTEVILLEKNEKLGKKLFITGKGRCNVTNACDMEGLFTNVVTNQKFLYSAFNEFDNKAVMKFLEDSGCHLKVERGDRVFPASDHSSDVIAALTRELQRRKVEIRLKTEVQEVLSVKNAEDKKQQVCGVLLKSGEHLVADSVIVATGGISYPSTGSTGDGYRFAEQTGHRLISCSPSLVPLNIQESWCHDVMGLSLKNVTVRLLAGEEEIYSGFGEMLFTHFGVSGPLILSASSYYAEYLTGKSKKGKRKQPEQKTVKLLIDLKPALDPQQLDRRLLREFESQPNKQFTNVLGGLFPTKLIPVMRQLSGIPSEKRVNEVSRTERKAFGELMKNLPLTVTGLRDYNEAVITKGGVSVKDVNPSTMESKVMSGLYFAGEILDLDALTGGFNLQIAWSTGYLAGQSLAQKAIEQR